MLCYLMRGPRLFFMTENLNSKFFRRALYFDMYAIHAIHAWQFDKLYHVA